MAESWEPNDDGSVWTFTIRQGVTFHDGTPLTAKDVVATFDRLSDPEQVERALGASRASSPPGEHEARRRRRPSSSRSTRRTATSRTWSARTTTTRSSSRRTTRATGRRRSSAPARGSSRSTRRGRASRSSGTRTTGTRRAARSPTGARSRSTRDERRRVLALQGGEVDIVAHFSVSGGKALLDGPEHHDHRDQGRAAPRDPHADGHGAVHRQARAPGHGAGARPPGARRRALRGQGRPRQRQPVRAGLPLDRHVRAAARAGHRAGQAAARRGRRAGRLRGHAGHAGRASRSPTSPCSSRTRRRRSASPSSSSSPTTAPYYGDAVYGDSPWLDSRHGHHRLRPPRRAERVPRRPARERRHLERRALQEPDVRRRSSPTTSRRSTSTPSGRSRSKIQTLLLDETPIIFPYFYNYLAAHGEERRQASSRPAWATSTSTEASVS